MYVWGDYNNGDFFNGNHSFFVDKKMLMSLEIFFLNNLFIKNNYNTCTTENVNTQKN